MQCSRPTESTYRSFFPVAVCDLSEIAKEQSSWHENTLKAVLFLAASNINCYSLKLVEK